MSLEPGWGSAITRRAPFSDNPHVGQRGQRTQQRILDAALKEFGEAGYHGCSVDRIAKRAGCSRVSFYQYFSSKEDVFGHLAAQVARQVDAAVEALDLLTPDEQSWTSLRTWIARYADIYERYGPVFHAFETAAASTPTVAALRAQAAEANVARIHSRVATTVLSPRELDAVIGLLLDAAARAYYLAEILRNAAPEAHARERIEDALADVIHRSLFGLVPDVNVHDSPGRPAPPALAFDPTMQDILLQDGDPMPELTDAGRGTLQELMACGRDVFVARGYHATRVDDVVAAAGLSHGAFYRYFKNKAHFARILVLQAMRPLSQTLAAIPQADSPGAPTRPALRCWLRNYNEMQVSEAAIIRVWIDATMHEPALGIDAAAAIDWGRRQMAGFLVPRGFGDVESEAIALLAIVDAFGAHLRSPETVDAASHVIERGLLGR